MKHSPVKKPLAPVARPSEPKIVAVPPEHEGVIEAITRPQPTEIGWG